MARLRYIFGLLIIVWTNLAYGQNFCSKDNLTGLWRQVESIPGVHANVDSLKILAVRSNRTIGTLDFRADGTFKYMFLDAADKKNSPYSLDTLTCEIILGTKKKAQKNSNLKVIYVDNQFLIFTDDNNPKGDITHLTMKVDGIQ